MVGLVCVGCVRGAHRARPRARFHDGGASSRIGWIQIRSWLRRPHGVLSLAYPAVGALIASRLPANPIGWIFCGLGVIYATQRFAIAYADHAPLETLALPWGEFAAWFSTWIRFFNPTLVVFLMLLFPSGRLPSRQWRIVVWLTVLGAAMSALGVAFMPGILLDHSNVENPFGIVWE